MLSQSVANAFTMMGDDGHSSTIEFIQKFNSVFDVMNIRYKSEGDKTNNKWKKVLNSSSDWRFEVR